MRELNCQAVVRRARNYKVCIKKGQLQDGTVLENTLNREFSPEEPRKVFVTDVTYIPVKEGWLYVSPVMDLCTREIVVCKMSTRQDMTLALDTLEALNAMTEGEVMLHSDQGGLYTSPMYRMRAKGYDITLSYSRKGNCWDNAVMENWNGMLKTEWLYHPEKRFDKKQLSATDAIKEIEAYCEYYNKNRIQAKLNYRSPEQFREAVVGSKG